MLQMLYWVDESDHLARVDEAWREFALENGAPELASERILGRPIASFCSDATTSWIWGLFLARARLGVAIEVQIRCDSPDFRRLFQVALSRDASLVRVTSRLISGEAREFVPLLDSSLPRSKGQLLCCSWCKLWKDPWGHWVEVEEFVSTLGLMGVDLLPEITHGICPTCRSSFAASASR